MRHVPPVHMNAFADLAQQLLDARFDVDFPENGSFTSTTSRGRKYWYYDGYDAATKRKSRKYVGPDDDPEIARRVSGFDEVKRGARARHPSVRSLLSAGFPRPDALTGKVVAGLARSGWFRLRGVLVGTVAFQTYPGLVGAFPPTDLRTGDVDLAMDHGISVSVGDSVDPVIDTLRTIDPTFSPVPHLTERARAGAFVNADGFRVEFLSPNRGSDDNQAGLTALPSAGGASAFPMRYLDYLIEGPDRSVLLHGAGIPILVPRPERFAVHKIMVSGMRRDAAKADKDARQAAFLVEALKTERGHDLTDALTDAAERGERWRTAILRGLPRQGPDVTTFVRDVIGGPGGAAEYGHPPNVTTATTK